MVHTSLISYRSPWSNFQGLSFSISVLPEHPICNYPVHGLRAPHYLLLPAMNTFTNIDNDLLDVITDRTAIKAAPKLGLVTSSESLIDPPQNRLGILHDDLSNVGSNETPTYFPFALIVTEHRMGTKKGQADRSLVAAWKTIYWRPSMRLLLALARPRLNSNYGWFHGFDVGLASSGTQRR